QPGRHHHQHCAQRASTAVCIQVPFLAAAILSEAKEARDTTKASKQVVQGGSQHRREPYQLAVRDIIRARRIGKIVHIEWPITDRDWRSRHCDLDC
ncbi:MAG: hypothetical protein WA594_14855, partial [Candidatus Sulfotelmatobacter sp.]